MKTTKERQEGGRKPASFTTNLATSLALNQALNYGRGETTEEKSQVKNEGTGEEEREDQKPTKEREKSDSGRLKASGEAIFKLMEEYKEEQKAREERQFAYLQKIHKDKIKTLSGVLEIVKKRSFNATYLCTNYLDFCWKFVNWNLLSCTKKTVNGV